MRLRHALASVVTIAACGAPSSSRAPVVSNVTDPPPTARPVAVDASSTLGVLALPAYATRPEAAPHWVALAPGAAAVVPGKAALGPGTYRALPAGGATAIALRAGATTSIDYGCDGGTSLDVIPLAGPAVKPGLVWVLPSPVPPEWQPASHALRAEIAERDRVRYVVGELVIEQRRLDKTHAALAIAVRGKTVHDETSEAYLMDGADPIDLDLKEGHAPGIPTVEAVFSVAPAGPYLVVLETSGYEGVAFETLVARESATEVVESLGFDAYYCAF
ncbi:MAG TPA: hypothetical protein VM261_32855 [Kofleriaceae bacterium]|nr:hypothetical protein [Kofleriaceae bacterium]